MAVEDLRANTANPASQGGSAGSNPVGATRSYPLYSRDFQRLTLGIVSIDLARVHIGYTNDLVWHATALCVRYGGLPRRMRAPSFGFRRRCLTESGRPRYAIGTHRADDRLPARPSSMTPTAIDGVEADVFELPDGSTFAVSSPGEWVIRHDRSASWSMT